ncbi:MAG: SpvB/TcaC N-terminal domain-containing protein, partial [Candidatus Saccharimonadaceae bacterium]
MKESNNVSKRENNGGTSSDFLSIEKGKTKSNSIEIPSISLPKGGGAIKGIDEKFQVNPVNGTSSFSIPFPLSPNRNGFTPQLSLSYNSGVGNGLFGIGWDLNLPSIQRRTDNKLPLYFDANNIENISEEDSFMFAGVEELVPYLDHKNDRWGVRQIKSGEFTIRSYRPRIEGGFSRIERIYHQDHGFYWRVTSKENITTFYGFSKSNRIADPKDDSKVFQWLPEFSFDDKGSWVKYDYKLEDLLNVKNEVHEKNRFNGNAPFTNKHLKRVIYGNQTAYYIDETRPYEVQLPIDTAHFFEVLFDYGEHDQENPIPDDNATWFTRKDPFSSYKACFEMRTYRLCQRVLIYHIFPELNHGLFTLVRSIDFDYAPSSREVTETTRPTELTYLTGITQKGYVRRSGSYASKALPKMVFDYQWLQWNTAVKDVSAENLDHAPVGISKNYQWVDLFNEGINGILTEQENGWFYKSNLGGDDHGNVSFSPAKPVIPKPSFMGLSTGVLQLQDLESNGQKQVVITSPGLQGYFELSDEGEWQPFKAFLKTLNLDLHNSDVRLFDVNGDGRPDVVLSDSGAFWWWENIGKVGYDSPQLAKKPYDEEQGPAIVFSDQQQRIYLADMSGDGLTDIVRISNREVCYWANLGYGRFSAKVTMGNAPVFDHPDQFNSAYLQLADISGTGATDIIYLGKNKFNAYLNFSGNSWSDATEIEPFFPAESPNKITVTDLLGNGTACIVWSSELPAYRSAPMRYIDLMGGKKPHIMRSHENGFGKKSEVEYKSSTWFYLQDKLKGEPWITKLPFPVQCVSKTIVSEKVTNVRFTSEYTYHHGYYDHAEREFRGFGRVEQTDSENFDVFEKTGASNIVPAEHHQSPVLTKTWFHTGAFLDRQLILTQFKKEYWQEVWKEKGFTSKAAEFELPDAILLAAGNLTGININELSADKLREVLRACKGMLLRQEVFGLDAEKQTADEKQVKGYADYDTALLEFQTEAQQTQLVPYFVSTHNCEIQLLQERDINHYAVFMVNESEAISYVYERNPEDPRIAHSLTIETDELGNVLESVTVVYPRFKEEEIIKNVPTDNVVIRNAKEAARKGQQKQWVTFTKNEFTNDIIEPESYYLRKGWETKTYELTGVNPTKSIFTIAEFKGKVETIQEIKYQQKATTGLQKRLVEHIKTIFYNADLSAPLLDGKQDIYGIPFENYQLAYTPDLLVDIFTPTALTAPMNVSDVDMKSGKYLKDNNNWWIQSGTVQYHRVGENFNEVKNHFFAPLSYTDPFDSVTEVFYDPLHFFMQKIIDALGNERQLLRFNYRTLSPVIMRDINDNISSVIVDELGLVKAAAVEGKAILNPSQGEEGDNLTGFTEQTEGIDSQNIIDFFNIARISVPQICNSTLLHQNARKLLGNASARMVYDFSQQPTVVASIVREQHVKQNPNISPLQISFEYSDGLGNVAMIKVQAEPGKFKAPDGTMLDSGSQLRWVGNGRTVLNNKGNPIKQFEPYFSTTPSYESDPVWVEQGISSTLYYDGAGRNIKTELPNGTFTKVIFNSWKRYSFDVNDTVKDSDWYKQRMVLGNGDPEKKAALQTEFHYNTPSCIVLDTLGRPTLSIDHNRWDDTPVGFKEFFYYTTSELDIEGNALSITDARGNIVMQYRYDLLGNQVMQTSMDAGKRWMLNNALGNPVKVWDERNHLYSYEYDALHRPTNKLVKGGEGTTPLNNNFEKIVYGENQLNAKAENLRGKMAVLFDTAGKVSHESFDFKGNLLESKRQFCQDYKNLPDWTMAVLVKMEQEIFTSKSEFDALNRPVKMFTPQTAQIPASIISPEYNEANLLKAVSAKLRGSNNVTPFVKDIDYDAKGHRISILYGNKTLTKYTYDPKTFRLLKLVTLRNSGADTLQDLNYTYDPMGNITFIKDESIQTLFFNNHRIEPNCDYVYDSIYRLIQATGREHIANNTAPDAYDAQRINLPHKGEGTQLQRYTQRYKYDEVGNMLLMENVNSWSRFLNYNHLNNQLLSAPIKNEIGTPFQYEYDAHGNMINMPHLSKMEWNFKDELQHIQINASIENDNASGAYYIYDAVGERIRKVVLKDNVTEERIYLGGFEIFRKSRSGNLEIERETLHIMDDVRRIAMIDTKIKLDHISELPLIRYQYSNHLGTASLELDGTDQAKIISYEEYYPYGSTCYQATDQLREVPVKRYRYTGKERDEESGLEYHSARYYV